MNCVTRLFGFVNKSNNFFNSIKYLNDSYFLHQSYLHRCYATEVEKAYKNSSVDVDKSNEKSLTLDDTVKKSNNINLQSDKSNFSSELEDVSDYAPATLPSFNFAAYVNNSPSLQEFIKLGVKLYKLEKSKEVAEFILKLDFEKNVKGHLTFLHDNGVTGDQLGEFISANPLIFKEDLDNLQIRINYLLSKRFLCDDISRIITKSPKWLSFSTKEIDARLGLFQSEFKLTGNEVRYLAAKQPKLITYKLPEIKTNIICFKEDMGFNKLEMKKVLLNKPRLFLSSKNHLLDRFTFVHNVMKINHELISEQPEILTCRLFRIKQRHQFLESLGRAQYDPKEPGYVSLNALISGTDADFCRDVAKTTVSVFNMFLKTQ